MTSDWGTFENMDPVLADPLMKEVMTGMLKLDIGSGGKEFERRDYSWTTVDKYCKADVRADMADLPYGESSVDAIFSAHALEHVAREQVPPALREWHRVLKPGGELTLLVPDLDYCVRLWLEKGMEALPYLFGSQEHDGQYHRTGWNVAGLREDLEDAGFTVASIGSKYIAEYNQDTIWAEAIKP